MEREHRATAFSSAAFLAEIASASAAAFLASASAAALLAGAAAARAQMSRLGVETLVATSMDTDKGGKRWVVGRWLGLLAIQRGNPVKGDRVEVGESSGDRKTLYDEGNTMSSSWGVYGVEKREGSSVSVMQGREVGDK